MRTNKTFTPRPSDIERAWWVVDAADLPLGRLASEIATVLRDARVPVEARQAGLTLIGWLARRMPQDPR